MTIPIERAAQFGGPQRFELLGNIVDDPCTSPCTGDTPVANAAGARPPTRRESRQGDGRDHRHRSDDIPVADVRARRRVKMSPSPQGARPTCAPPSRRSQIEVCRDQTSASRCRRSAAARRCATSAVQPGAHHLAPDLPTGREQGFDFELPRCAASPRLEACRPRSASASLERWRARRPIRSSRPAVRFFAPLRYLNPAQFEAVVREGEQQFRSCGKSCRGPIDSHSAFRPLSRMMRPVAAEVGVDSRLQLGRRARLRHAPWPISSRARRQRHGFLDIIEIF